MTNRSADAVIIGSGLNSLVCAYSLVQNGWSVIILEQADTAGGAVKTKGLTVDGFAHDWAAMNLSLFAGSPFFRQYNADLMNLGLEYL